MKVPLEEALSESLESPDEFFRIVVDHHGRNVKSVLQTVLGKCSKKCASALCEALGNLAEVAVDALKQLPPVPADATAEKERGCRSRTASKRSAKMGTSSGSSRIPMDDGDKSRKAGETEELIGTDENCDGRQVPLSKTLKSRKEVVAVLRASVTLAQLSIMCEGGQNKRVFEVRGVLHIVKSLHDILVFLEDAPDLQDSIARLCEQCWREGFPGREALVAQSLPFLLSKSLGSNRKVDVRRAYLMRDALLLFDFMDESAVDLKHLLIRCIVTPLYLRSVDGQRFISFLFGLNAQLVKELACIIFSQIPFGRKSILHAYGEILYRAWKVDVGPCLYVIEHSCIQRLIEGAVYASSKALASSARKVLEAFNCQRAEEGVEGMLFRLQEPLLFRALQVANSNVRRNALLLLIDMFPLQDPEAPKEEKEALLEKQFTLLEKLLFDASPDIRSVAVEGVCRILRLFWEIIPSASTVRLLSHIVRDISKDQSSSTVRLAVLRGVTYLLENPHSHPLLRALLPKLAPVLKDPVLNVRLGVTDLLLAIKDIRSIKFYKVANLDSILSSLATDNDAVARRLTRLLIPTYFPAKLPVAEACNRCFALIKRFPEAGGRFCAWAMEEGASPASLLELAVTLSRLAQCGSVETKELEGIILALAEVCNSMASSEEWRNALGKFFTGDILNSLLKAATTPRARSSIMRLASLIPPTHVPELLQYCEALVISKRNISPDSSARHEIKAVHAFVLAWGGFDDLISSLIDLLSAVDYSSIASNTNLRDAAAKRLGSQTKRGSKRANSSRTKATRIKEFSSLEPNDNVGSISSSERHFIAAAGAAWQVENLLSQSETRKALLSCKFLPELLAYLRKLAQLTLTNFVECDLIARGMLLSPVVAYLGLSAHLTLEHDNLSNILNTESSRKRQKHYSNVKSTAKAPGPMLAFDSVIEELLVWAKKLLNTSSRCFSDMRASASSRREAEEYPQVQNETVSSEKLQSEIACPQSSGKAKKSGIRGMRQKEAPLNHIGGVQVVRMITALLRSTLDAFDLGLIAEKSVQSSCVRFACASIMLMSDAIKLATSMDNAKADETDSLAVALKDLSGCLKASSTYAAKLINICMKDTSAYILDLSALANCLLDLITNTEQKNRSGSSVSLMPTLKSWIPDLLIAVTRIPMTRVAFEGNQNPGSTLDQEEAIALDVLFRDDKQPLSRPWLHHLALLSFQSLSPSELLDTNNHNPEAQVEIEEEEGNKSGSSDDTLSAKEKTVSSRSAMNLMTAIVKLFQKGNPEIVEAFAIKILAFAGECVQKKIYSDALGSVDLICRKILGCRVSQQRWGIGRPKNVLLAGLKDVYSKVSFEIEEASSSSSLERQKDEQKLVLAQRLLRETINSPCFQEINKERGN
ncbi:hypothetical protein O6H91_04G021800 [Diphasiastrum complanatum]|uniref:Uncharacterized protein n=1 Tax=Diphasiastrum complanatum TaxID=34168 RepID=A0ACC2DUT1_DIPCM|nr:hypothetical protein O6H91_Y565300 [Diphasiastrum complanatum]KAJ7558018.1 hypothetical protein O6H91_04G021800 [Diphasiastrum complanatum]